MLRESAGFAVAALTFGTALLFSADAVAVDGIFIPQNEAPSYDSDYAASMRIQGAAANTPEADGRPGEYYFARAAEAVRKHDYAFAIQMYQVAASWAYKPAEYNLGVMYARGQGVPADMPRAMAWMALAAERNDAHYVDAREAVYAELTPEQFEQANVIWRELKQTYGDEVALRRAKARWAEVKANMTGSRVGSEAVPLDVSMGKPGLQDPTGPKVMAGPQADVANALRSIASTPGEVTSGTGVDGSLAYKQLRQSSNPYDPKFDRYAGGTAIVGPPETLRAADRKKRADPQDPPQNL